MVRRNASDSNSKQDPANDPLSLVRRPVSISRLVLAWSLVWETRFVQNKVVAHLDDGRIIKGITHDFDPLREAFHVLSAEGGGIPQTVRIDGLKALFYVKDFLGNREYDPPDGFGSAFSRGKRCIVTFFDGEVIFGSTPDFNEGGVGFHLYPADPEDNNVKIFVPSRSARAVEFPVEA